MNQEGCKKLKLKKKSGCSCFLLEREDREKIIRDRDELYKLSVKEEEDNTRSVSWG